MIRVTCAVIRNEDGAVLVVQRGGSTDHPFKWEFPGGKLIQGETEEECIIREVSEELSMGIVICAKLPEVEHEYVNKKIVLIPFICDTLDEVPLLSEHLDYRWVPVNELMSVDFSEADIFVARGYMETIKEMEVKPEELVPESKEESVDDMELQEMVNRMMSMKEAEWVATSAIENPAIFVKLLEYSQSPDKKLAFHASWTLSKVCDRFPDIIVPYLSRIVEMLSQLKNESAERSFLRILSLSDINNISIEQQGLLADHCFRALSSGISAIAIKAYSMEILYKLSLKYPELANELSVSIRMLESEGSAGILARGRIIMKRLAAISVNTKSGKSLS